MPSAADQVLLEALRLAPRRYRMPALPADAAAAEAAGPDVAVAFAIEALRRGQREEEPGLAKLFVRSLAALISRALDSGTGDPSFQAMVLAGQERVVGEHLELASQGGADQRRVRAAIDAFAHPGKWRGQAMPDSLVRLHASAQSGYWPAVRESARALAGTDWATQGAALLAEPALARLERAASIQRDPAVQRYLALAAARGPLADSEEAAGQGRAAARAGAAVEQDTVDAFQRLATGLDASGSGHHRVARGLRPRSGLPRATHGAKDEWDVALLRAVEGSDAFDLVLLAEAKASPSSAVSDWPRLRRGLERLAQVPQGVDPVFSGDEGEVRVRGESLRDFAPPQRGLPPRVIYCCTAEEARTPLLSAPARAMLLQQPASHADAGALGRGEPADPGMLAPLWDALTRSPQLRPVLEQYETARSAREVMLHPDDLRRLRP